MIKLKKILCVVLTICGIAFGIAGFVVPPTGIIHNSVLILIAQIFTFAATLLGIDLRYKEKFGFDENLTHNENLKK